MLNSIYNFFATNPSEEDEEKIIAQLNASGCSPELKNTNIEQIIYDSCKQLNNNENAIQRIVTPDGKKELIVNYKDNTLISNVLQAVGKDEKGEDLLKPISTKYFVNPQNDINENKQEKDKENNQQLQFIKEMKSMINQQSKHGSSKMTKMEKKAKAKANQAKAHQDSTAKPESKSHKTTENDQNKQNQNDKNKMSKVENHEETKQSHDATQQMVDPITGVLKLKKNKNKKTKEVSLTINHNNLQQLVQMLQAHSNQAGLANGNDLGSSLGLEGKDTSNLQLKQVSKCRCSDDNKEQICSTCSNQTFEALDGNKQALNLIMQLISNNMQSSKGEHGSSPCREHGSPNCSSCEPDSQSLAGAGNIIDPQLLESLFSIDQEEEECTDSSDEYEDEDDELENEEEKEASGADDGTVKKGGREQGERAKDPSGKSGISNEQKAKVFDCHSSEEDDDDDDNYQSRADFLHSDENSKKTSTADKQKIRDKLQKRRKQLEAQKAHMQHQQKMQRIKQQQQLKKGVSHSQKSYSEDKIEDSGSQAKGEDSLECGEEYFAEYGLKTSENSQIDGFSVQEKMQQNTHVEYDDEENVDDSDSQSLCGRAPTEQQTSGSTGAVGGGNDTTVEGDNSSQYEDIENDGQYLDDDEGDIDSGDMAQDNIHKLLKQKLKVSDKLSLQFHRFHQNFQRNVEFIIQFEYNILPQQKCYQSIGTIPSLNNSGGDQSYQYLNDQRARDTAQLILKKKYNNFRKLCEQNCKCFTGPHSVLQIFIEKIVQAIESFGQKLRNLTKDDLLLWIENHDNFVSDDEKDGKNLNELNYSINGIDLNLIFKMQSQQQAVAEGFKTGMAEALQEIKEGNTPKSQTDTQVQQTLKYIEQNTKSLEAKEKLRQLGQMSDRDIKKLVQKASDYLKTKKKQGLKFKPLLKNLPNYTLFLQNVVCHYNLIIKQYAPAISRHFTEMTKVIKEGNSYEFPSQDIHRTIINKLIMNDQTLFKHFFTHIKQEYTKHEKAIKKKMSNAAHGDCDLSKQAQNLIKFVETYEQFTKEVHNDIEKGVSLLNIDYYMRDLRKHAIQEYDEVHQIEVKLMAQETNQDKIEKPELNELLNQRYGFTPSMNNSNHSNAQGWDQNDQNLLNGGLNDLLNSQAMQDEMFDLSLLDAKEKKKLKKKQRKRDKKIKQQMAQHGLLPPDGDGCNHGATVDADDLDSAPDTEAMQAFQSGFMNGQLSEDNCYDIQSSTFIYEKLHKLNQCDQDDENPNLDPENTDSPDTRKRKPKKGKNGGKLSHEEIRNLSTEELFSYIENEGKKLKQAAANPSNNMAEAMQQWNDSRQIQQVRLKAKAFMAQNQQAQKDKEAQDQSKTKKKSIDPNHYTCKFCNGTIDPKTANFVHEKFCLVAKTHIQHDQAERNNGDRIHPSESGRRDKKSQKSDLSNKLKRYLQTGQNSDFNSTRGSSNYQDDKNDPEDNQDEDKQIAEFAKKLEQNLKHPPLRTIGAGGQRRRRKLKPNVSKDWLNKKRRELKSQIQQNFSDKDKMYDAGFSESKSNASPDGKQFSSIDSRNKQLDDLTPDQIQASHQSQPGQKSTKMPHINPKKLNLSMSASQNAKNLQQAKNKK